MLMALSSAAADQPKDPDATLPKSFGGTIIATTPVVLTLFSTMLAGLSSSEMVRAQYYRSLAAQNQSKTGDQWNFFQAKRIRSTIIEQDLDLGPARPYRIDPARLEAALQRLIQELQTSRQAADNLNQQASQAPPDDPVRQAAHWLAETAKEQAAGSPQSLAAVREAFKSKEVADAFLHLGVEELPGQDKNTKADEPADDDQVGDALQAVRDRRPEKEIGALVLRIGENRLQEAVEAAEARTQAFEKASKKVDKEVFKPIDRLVKQLDRGAYLVHRATLDLERVWHETDAQNKKDRFPSGTADRVAAVIRSDTAVQRSRETLADYPAARKDYTARRQDQEARHNEQVGGRYELRVHYNSAVSDQHRLRSQLFFVAMLLAQGGAAIGSLAMAWRRRTSLWSLASVAGLAAILFSAYVFLFIAPGPLAGRRPF
jgi:hypothetical protein